MSVKYNVGLVLALGALENGVKSIRQFIPHDEKIQRVYEDLCTQVDVLEELLYGKHK